MLLSSFILLFHPLWTLPVYGFFFAAGWGTTNRFSLPSLDLGRDPSTCTTNVGGKSIQGIHIDGGCRYTVRYGDAKRWETSQASSSLGTNIHSLPPACPQTQGGYADGESQSEDCLYAVVYTPLHIPPIASLPVFVWVHGGSFNSGSASAPGLSGSRLATEGNIIVVVLQYRLGVFGYLPPASSTSSKDPNLGVGDVVLTLKWLRNSARDFGGDGGRVVIGGQSSGAHMIRALWATPAARGFFRGAILQSDPMFYGLATPAITDTLAKSFYAIPAIATCKTLDCLRNLPADQIIAAQEQLVQTAPFTIPGVPLGEPIRPTFNTPSIPLDPTSALYNQPGRLSTPPNQLPILLTTTSNEGGQIVNSLFPSPVPISNDTLLYTLSLLLGAERAGAIIQSGKYPIEGGDDAFRETFERMVTDGIWKCPVRQVGREWAKNGGRVWVGEWTKGKEYASNRGGGYCSRKERVCHEVTIYCLSSEALMNCRQARSTWISFIKTLDPNASPDGLRRWHPFTSNSGDRDVLAIGGGDVGKCPLDLWGTEVKYDWQVYT